MKLYVMTVLDGEDERASYWTVAEDEAHAKQNLEKEWRENGWLLDDDDVESFVIDCYEVDHVDGYKISVEKV